MVLAQLRRIGPALMLPVVWALAACAPGSGEGLDENGRPLSESPGIPLGPTLDAIQANVLTPNCAISGCHIGATAPLGLRLDEGNSFALLVSVPSVQVPALFRVAPGDPDVSYLVQKIEGTAAAGGRMPLNGPPFLAQTTIDVIRQWIADGALPGSGSAAAPQVVSVTPPDGTSLDALPAQLQVIFTEPMDGSLLSAATVQLIGSGGDGSFNDGNEVTLVPASLMLDAGNPRLLTVDLTGVAAGVDDYRLTLVGTGATVLASQQGLALDGDADGAAGGDFTSQFAVVDVLPTLDSIQANVFTPTCATAGCHEGPAGPGLPAGKDLTSAAASRASLVNILSEQAVPMLFRVDPGNSGDSYLVQNLEGTAGVGQQMPRGGPPLPPATIAVIRTWIDSGAP